MMPVHLLLAAALVAFAMPAAAQSTDPPVTAMKVTVLSTMLVGNAREGVGEWGFAAVLEVDGRRWLIDTGARAETVLKNAAELKVDLSDITDVVITHNHDDHTGGLLTLRREMAKKNPKALSRAHVAKGIFTSRARSAGPRRRRPAAHQGRIREARRHVRRVRQADRAWRPASG